MFKCDKCGLCCRMVKGSPLDKFDRGDGVCRFLTKDNLCRIYDHRPLICNVERLYSERFRNTMSREHWERLQTESCKQIKKLFREGPQSP